MDTSLSQLERIDNNFCESVWDFKSRKMSGGRYYDKFSTGDVLLAVFTLDRIRPILFAVDKRDRSLVLDIQLLCIQPAPPMLIEGVFRLTVAFPISNPHEF